MKKITLTAIIIFTFLLTQAQTTSTAQWLRHACPTSAFNSPILGDVVASDNAGNAYNSGFMTTTHFTMDTMVRVVFPHKNYLNKYNDAGERLWTKTFGGTSPNSFAQVTRMKCDDAGNLYMSGDFGINGGDSISFGSSFYTAATGGGAFIAKFDSNGNEIWVRWQNSTSGSFRFTDFDIANGYIYLCGVGNFGSYGFGSFTFTTNNPQNALIAKMDINGNILNAELIDPNITCEAYGIAASKVTNSVYVVGEQIVAGLPATMIVDGKSLPQVNGATNSFILKMDASFSAQWLKGGVTYLRQFANVGSGPNCLKQVELDKFDNLYMIGNGNGDSTRFGSLSFIHDTTTYNTTTVFPQDVYLVKYNSAGTEQWLKFGQSNRSDFVHDLVVDQWGDAIIAVGSGSNAIGGFIFETDTLPTGPFTISGLVKYAPNGSLIYTKSFHSSQSFRQLSMPNDSTFFVTGTGLQYAFPFDTITTVTACENLAGDGFIPQKMIMTKFADPTYIVGRNMATTIPVSIISVKAYQQSTGNKVEWVTASEINVNRYEIEKSIDGRQFTVMGIVPAKSNNGGGNTTYTYVDANPNIGNNYYRIKLVDNDSKIKYTQVVNVKIGTGKNIFTVAPNPVQGNTFNLQLQGVDKGLLVLTMYNSRGQQVISKFINHSGGSATQTVNFGNIAKGIYQLQITGSSSVRSIKTILIQ